MIWTEGPNLLTNPFYLLKEDLSLGMILWQKTNKQRELVKLVDRLIDLPDNFYTFYQ